MRVVWTRKASAQKDAIWQYLADFSLTYADRVEQRLEARAATLGTMAMQGRYAGSSERRLSIPDVQYVIDYRIDEDAVRILRVSSTAQDRSE